MGERTFANEKADLIVSGAVNEDCGAPVVDVAEAVFGVGGASREAEPENVNGDAALDDIKMRGGNCGRVAAVAADCERRMNFHRSVRSLHADTNDAGPISAASGSGFAEPGDFVFHEQTEAGEDGGFGGEEVEEVPLRHERDELCGRWEGSEFRHWIRVAADVEAESFNLAVMNLEEIVQPPN